MTTTSPATPLDYGQRRFSRKRLVLWSIVLAVIIPLPVLMYNKFGKVMWQRVQLVWIESQLPERLVDMDSTDPKTQADRDAVKRWMDCLNHPGGRWYMPITTISGEKRILTTYRGQMLVAVMSGGPGVPPLTLTQPFSSWESMEYGTFWSGPQKNKFNLGIGLPYPERGVQVHPTKPGWIQLDVTIGGRRATVDMQVEGANFAADNPVYKD
jgi:hypothetical protein